VIEWVIPNHDRAYASFEETKKGSMQQRELADLRLTFLVSEETAARKKSEVKSTN
jgi:hypothetical protein